MKPTLSQIFGTKPANAKPSLDDIFAGAPAVEPKAPNALEGFAQGIAKGEVSTIKGLAGLGGKIADQTVGRVINAVQGNGFVPSDSANYRAFDDAVGGEDKAKKLTVPEGTAEKAGFTTEKIAEFFIPAGKAAKAEQTINILSQGIKTPLLAAGARIGGKAAVQGVAAGTINLAQTGGDVGEAAKTAAGAGIVRGALAGAGETLRALKIPERVYSVIFKNSKQDMLSELTADGISDLARKNPKLYNDFVEKGIIKTVGGQPRINETLAEQALHKGLTGSFRNMAGEVITKSLQAEDDVQNIMKSYKGTINVSEPQFVKVLKRIASEYDDVGFGEVASQADDLATKLTNAKGNVDGQTALELRRFLDRMRVASSFDKPASSLSMTQSNFKTLADTVRSRIATITGEADEVGGVLTPENFVPKTINRMVTTLKTVADDAAQTGKKIATQDLVKEAIRETSAQLRANGDDILADAIEKIKPSSVKSLDALKTIMMDTAGVKSIGSVMKDYSFYIDALEAIAREAAKRGNSQVLGMIDSLFLGGAAVSPNPTSLLTIGLLRRMVQSPSALTNIGQAINKSTASPALSGALGATSAGVSSAVSPQSGQQ